VAADLLLGIDVGTGGCKALLIDTSGSVLASVTTDYPLATPRPLWSEQDPADWWQATATSVRAVLEQAGADAARVACLGLTGQMHGLVLLDAAGEVLRPAILWNDQRCADQCARIHERVGLERMIAISGKPALTGFTAPKVLWVRDEEPHVFRAATRMLLPKDYVKWRLTDVLCSDVADASGTSLFDIARRDWSDELVETLEIPRGWLPDVHESPAVAGALGAAGADATGLAEGTPVVAGAGDQAAEAVGCGIIDASACSVTIGTSGVVFAATDTPRIDPQGRMHAYCHALPGSWHVMGVMLSAGGSLRWYRDTLGNGESYERLIDAAAEAPAGCEGLTFLPYLSGERTPHADPHARGAFVGLTLRHDRRHMTRAVLEGVAFGLRDCLDLLTPLSIPVERVRLSGGGARSALWRQILADVLRMEVATVNVTQGAAFGAAVLAGVGEGVFENVGDAARSIVRETGTTSPGPDADRYHGAYERYRALYPALRGSTPRN
jgi:xylulokinase